MSQIQTTSTNTAPKTGSPYYRLVYNAATKKVVACFYSDSVTETKDSLYCSTSWAEVQAFATGDNLTGLPTKDPATSKA